MTVSAPTSIPDVFHKHREMIRAQGHLINPYRLGKSVGYADEELSCPYTNPRSVKLYKEGWKSGYWTRLRDQKTS